MSYQLVNRRTKILPLATSHIAHLRNQFNHVFALLISLPSFTSINFYQNSPKINIFLQNIQNFRASGASETAPIADFWLWVWWNETWLVINKYWIVPQTEVSD